MYRLLYREPSGGRKKITSNVQVLPHDASLRSQRPRLVILSRYVVDFRYPGFSTSTRAMRAALRQAGVIRFKMRAILGLS
jgi:hypothetical protein